MKILSLCSPYINEILQDDRMQITKIKYQHLSNLIYYSDDINKYVEDGSVDGIESLKGGYDLVIMDFLSLIDEGIDYKGRILARNQTNKITRQLKDDARKVVIESLKVIMNTLLREYHPSQICMLNLKNIAINDQEANAARFLEDYNFFCENNVKYLPLCNKVEISEVVFLELNKFNFSQATIDEITNKINELNIAKSIYKGEKVYSSTQNIRYYFEKAKLFNKDKLIISFSSFSTATPKYNYVNTLKGVDCNKLFILDDYGVKGSYYIGIDGDFDIETSVISLITEIMKENDITFKSVTSIGSSKGGSAALYYGLKYNFGNVIAGAPQYKIGTYLIDLTIKEYAIDIFGGLNPSNRIKYDNLIRKIARKEQNTKVSILTGDGDPQYERVLKEFERIGDELKLNYKIDKCNIEAHSEISKVFPRYLLENIEGILSGKGCIKGNMLLNIFSKFN